jgi:uncharacterized protein
VRVAAGVLDVVREHVAAFNAGDLDGVMAGFEEAAVFSTGAEVLVGARAIRALFAGAFSAPFEARLELRATTVEGDTAACELVEHLALDDGSSHLVAMAAFYTVRDGRLARVKVYREGTADLPT